MFRLLCQFFYIHVHLTRLWCRQCIFCRRKQLKCTTKIAHLVSPQPCTCSIDRCSALTHWLKDFQGSLSSLLSIIVVWNSVFLKKAQITFVCAFVHKKGTYGGSEKSWWKNVTNCYLVVINSNQCEVKPSWGPLLGVLTRVPRALLSAPRGPVAVLVRPARPAEPSTCADFLDCSRESSTWNPVLPNRRV